MDDPLSALAAEPTAPATRDVYEVIERGRLALLADKFQEAADAIEEALTMPEFLTLEPLGAVPRLSPRCVC